MAETVELLWSTLWAANPWPGRLIILLIVGVVTSALVVGNRQLQRYGREEHALRWVSRFLRGWSGGGGQPTDLDEDEEDESEEQEVPSEQAEDVGAPETGEPEPVDALEPDELMARLLEETGTSRLMDDSLVGDRIRAIAEMRRYRVKVDVDTLQELALYRDAARAGHGFPSFAAGLSMMLGILGTFLGLAAMVQEIHLGLPSQTANLNLDSWMSSVEQLGSVLGGMKTAFSTSLVGMSGAIVASSVAYWVGHRRRQVFELLERVTAAELVPATVPAVEDESLLVQVSNQLDESFSFLDEIYRQNQEALKDLSAAQEAFGEVVDDIRDITRGQAARNLDGLLGQLADANQSVLAVSRQIPRIVSTFETTARELRGSAEEMHRRVANAHSGSGLILGLRPATWLAIFGAGAALLVLARAINAL